MCELKLYNSENILKFCTFFWEYGEKGYMQFAKKRYISNYLKSFKKKMFIHSVRQIKKINKAFLNNFFLFKRAIFYFLIRFKNSLKLILEVSLLLPYMRSKNYHRVFLIIKIENSYNNF